MFIDKISNSHMILLVLLITLVVSTATAVSVLSVVYDRLITAQTDIQQPTIIRQTINRIIEKEADRAARPAPAVVTEVQRAPQPVNQEETRSALLADIETSTVQIYAGSTVVGTGLFVSPDGTIISPSSRLKKNKKYMIRPDTDTTVPFSVIKTSGIYSLLIPDTEHTPEAHIPIIDADTDIPLGKPVIIVGGTGDNTRLYTEIISQKRTQKDGEREVLTSATVSEVFKPSGIFVDGTLIGIIRGNSPWISLLSSDLLIEEQPADSEPQPAP